MANTPEAHIDLELWKNKRIAPASDRWKWEWTTWDPIIEQIHSGDFNFESIACPVCGTRNVYALFRARAARYDVEASRFRYWAERWMGCRNCGTQVRDWAEIPEWIKDEDVVWASVRLRQYAEEKLTQEGVDFRMPDQNGGTSNAADDASS